jgi:transcriptional regulator with AAA-type ATPase domain/ligand-binding sensor domain-containing protein
MLTEANRIEGRLLMLDGATPHVAVHVQVVRNGEVVDTTLSDDHGRYRLTDLMPGMYRVRCQILGGYVYYQSTLDGSRATLYESQEEEWTSRDARELLRVEIGTTIKNIDFRFPPFKKGTWRSYTFLDGLADNFVQAIHCDPDRIMWFGTRGGISRYDHNTFVNFTKEDGLAHNFVLTIYCDPHGIMWFGTWGGISRYDGKTFLNFTEEDGLVNNRVNTIYCDPDGTMWFGTWGGISRYDGETFVNFTERDGLACNDVRSIHRDSGGRLWFGTFGGGASVSDEGEIVNFTSEDGLAGNHINVIRGDRNGLVWFGAEEGGISCYDGKTFVSFTKKDGLAHDAIRSIHCEPDGTVWFGTFGAGVSMYDGKQFINFTSEDGLAGEHVVAIHRDPNGVLWFGTFGGVSCYDRSQFITFTPKDGLGSNEVAAVHRDRDGVMWFGTCGGVSRYDGKRFTTFTTEDGLAHNWIQAIHRHPDGTIWFGTLRGGVTSYDGRDFTNFTTKDGLANDNVNTICCASDNALWFGTHDGVSRYDGKRFTSLNTKDGLPDGFVEVIHCDPEGNLWFGTHAGVSVYDGKRFATLATDDRLAKSIIEAIHSGTDNTLWFGTYDGVFQYDGKQFVTAFSTKDGLANNLVCSIFCDQNGIMWFGTQSGGVSVYDGVCWTSLDTRDGLPDNHVHFIHPDTEGSLWFGTGRGVTRYLRSTNAPEVRIVSVRVNGEHVDPEVIPSITTGSHVAIEYSAIDFKTAPEKRQYRYRIKEIDSDWHKPTKSAQFEWIPEEPGTYTFEVQAIDRDLNYSEPVALNLTVQPDPVLVSLQTELAHLRHEMKKEYEFQNIIGGSLAIMQVRALMEKAIDSELTVLITGETGAGKELVAWAIHHKLFGHRKGAFTGAHEDQMGLFEAAAGGTVVLDEIGEMSQDMQIQLLRVLEERKIQRLGEHILRDVNVRIMAMTNRDLVKEVTTGRFREDLFYRLNEFPIHMPSLRERREDIPLLAEHFLKEYLQEHDRKLYGLASDVFDMLQNYPWPGNVRELRNEIHRACALAEEGSWLETYHFSSQVTRGESLIQDIMSQQLSYSQSLDRFRRRLVEEALRECRGNRTHAAKLLGMDRSNLVALIKRLGIKA